MADYWLKLYTEILDDPKMGILSDRHWRRVIELFLAAKRVSNTGELPEITHLAYMLRMKVKDLETDLVALEKTGIVTWNGQCWFIPKFAQRQSASSDAERKAAQRDKRRSRQYKETVIDEDNENVTNRDNNVTENVTEDVTKEEKNKPDDCHETSHEEVTKLSRCVKQRTELRDRVKRTEKRLKDLTDQPEKTPADGNIKIPKPQKHKYGEFKNVLLTDDELRKYQEKNPYDWQQRIERMSSGIEMKGYKYSSHYLALLNWDRNEKSRNSVLPNQNSQQGSQQRGVLGMNFVDIVTGRDQ